MTRLLWLAPGLVDPEESFSQLAGKRPAPEPLTFAAATPDAIRKSLADVILVDGREDPTEAAAVIRKLRKDTEAPFIVVIAPEAMQDFDWTCGAAEFVSADSSTEETAVRILRVTHPFEVAPAETIRRGDITINRERFEVRVRGEVLDLTFKEFELLEYLASRPGKVCSRRELLTEVWGYEFFGGTRTVDVHIRRLRAKLGHGASAVETVRNVGYRFAG